MVTLIELSSNYEGMVIIKNNLKNIYVNITVIKSSNTYRADSRFAPSQWEMSLLCNAFVRQKPRISPVHILNRSLTSSIKASWDSPMVWVREWSTCSSTLHLPLYHCYVTHTGPQGHEVNNTMENYIHYQPRIMHMIHESWHWSVLLISFRATSISIGYMNWMKSECCHFNEIFIPGCTVNLTTFDAANGENSVKMIYTYCPFHVLLYKSILPISSRVTSLTLGQSYDCPSVSEATLKDMGK